jgi:recombination protein RecT
MERQQSSITDITALAERASKRNGRATTGSAKGAKTSESSEQMVIGVLKSDAFKQEVDRCVPNGVSYDVDGLLRVVQTQLRQDPKLAACDPRTVLGATMECAQMGLMPGPLNHVFIATREVMTAGAGFRIEAQVIVGYKGLISLAVRGGDVVSISSRTVTDKEIEGGMFDLHYEGDRDVMVHRPILMGDRGDDVLAYCLIRFKDGRFAVEVMRKEDIENIKFSAMAKNGSSEDSPWVKHEMEMWRKTVIRRAMKYIDLRVEGLNRAVSLDEKSATGESQDLGEELKGKYGLTDIERQVDSVERASSTGTSNSSTLSVVSESGASAKVDDDDPSSGS